MNYENTLDFARKADEQDPLRSCRQQFYIPLHEGKECIYFTGNSLGLQPRATREAVLAELEDWAKLGVEGHFKAANPWFSYHELFPSLLAPIVGGKKEEIVVMNGLTVNIHLLLASFTGRLKSGIKFFARQRLFLPINMRSKPHCACMASILLRRSLKFRLMKKSRVWTKSCCCR